MRVSSVKLKIPSFGIEEWIILEGGSNKSVRYLLDKYIISHPFLGAKGLAYTESGGYLKSLKYNNAGSITIEQEAPSRLIGGGSYVTVFWSCRITALSGRPYRGRFPRVEVPMDEIINFKDGDTLSLGLIAVLSSVLI